MEGEVLVCAGGWSPPSPVAPIDNLAFRNIKVRAKSASHFDCV